MTTVSRLEKQTMRAVTRRIVPLMFLLYLGAYIDRISLGYAQLKMGKDLGIDPAVFGLVASAFYVGFTLCEVPSNAMLYRFGSRVWLARIGITWGIVTILTGFVQNQTQLIIVRMLLGVAEAGLGPGILFFAASFFPAEYKARAAGLFFVGAPLAGVVAGPIAGLILDNVTWGGLESWRWIFILFGTPVIVFGILISILVTDTVEKSKWLNPEQRKWLKETISNEQDATVEMDSTRHGGGLWSTIRDSRTLLMAFFQFTAVSGVVGLSFYVPQIVKRLVSSGTSLTTIGFLSAIPFLVGCAAMVGMARSSDRRGERVWHLGIPMIVAAVALALLPLVADNPMLGMIVLCIGGGSAFGYSAPSYSMAQEQFVGRRAALGLAVVTSGAALAGLVAPYVFGWLTQLTGSTDVGVAYLAASVGVGGSTVLLTRKKWITITAQVSDAPPEYCGSFHRAPTEGTGTALEAGSGDIPQPHDERSIG